MANVWTGTRDDGQGDAGSSNGHELGTKTKPNVAYGLSGSTDFSWTWQGLSNRLPKASTFSLYAISEAQVVASIPALSPWGVMTLAVLLLMMALWLVPVPLR